MSAKIDLSGLPVNAKTYIVELEIENERLKAQNTILNDQLANSEERVKKLEDAALQRMLKDAHKNNPSDGGPSPMCA